MISFGETLNLLSKHLNPWLEKFFAVEIRRARPKWYSSRVLRHYLSSDPKLIFDVGANVGNISRLLSKEFPSANIHSFEPVPRSHEKLKILSKNNKNIFAINVALSDARGRLKMNVPADAEKARVCGDPSEGTGNTFDVTAERVDEYCAKNSIDVIDLLKIDAEGHDLNVLKGCGASLRNTRVVVCEVGFPKTPTPWCDFQEVFAFLSKAGFDLAGLYDVQYDGSGQMAFANALFVNSKQP